MYASRDTLANFDAMAQSYLGFLIAWRRLAKQKPRTIQHGRLGSAEGNDGAYEDEVTGSYVTQTFRMRLS